jgi:membrane protease YdiL (CAAX protease family)
MPKMEPPSTRPKTDEAAGPSENTNWRAIDAFICAVVLIVLSFCFNQLLWRISRDSTVSANWLGSPLGTLALRFFRAAWWLLVVYLFTRARTVPEFLSRCGLSAPPSLVGWFAAWVGVGIGWLNLYGVIKGWIPQSQISSDYYLQGGMMWWSYAAYLVMLAPFYEEAVMRGFLYPAFRGTYGVMPSVFFVVCVAGYFHWGLLSRPLSFICVAAGAVLLCLIRERTASLWNCILFHAAYNATVTLRWWFCVLGLLALLPLCARVSSNKTLQRAAPSR